MKLSVVIPVFNEERTLERVIERVKAAPAEILEIILVDDASTDSTGDILKKIEERDEQCRVFRHLENRGKGAALRTGIANAQGDIVIIQDADLEYNPAEYDVMLKPILDGRADVVYGSRFVTTRERRVVYYWHMVGNTFLTTFSNMMTNLNLTDMETCYKAFKREIIQGVQIEEDRFGFEPEITAKIARRRCVIYEVGISYSGRTYEEGKKINWKDGVRALYCIVKYNLFSR